jgi:prepilin-type N-terminal cleavage/methylation domain-containing protein
MDRGFTLVETLTAIAIIAIVAGIAYPVTMSAKRSGKVTQTVQNLRSLHAGAILYQSEQDHQSAGTPEQMRLPTFIGTTSADNNPPAYIASWYKGMKSPFGTPDDNDYQSFLIPAAIDGMPVTWHTCTKYVGDKCIMYLDTHEPGYDPRTGYKLIYVPSAIKRLRGVALAGNLVTRNATGDPIDQKWWIPELNNRSTYK